MFVRWKSDVVQKKRGSRLGTEKSLTAVLVESRRIDGKPRLRHVAYIGTIREGAIQQGKQGDILGFWDKVDWTLGRLDIDPATRQKIETRIAERIPRPDPAVVPIARVAYYKMLSGRFD